MDEYKKEVEDEHGAITIGYYVSGKIGGQVSYPIRILFRVIEKCVPWLTAIWSLCVQAFRTNSKNDGAANCQEEKVSEIY